MSFPNPNSAESGFDHQVEMFTNSYIPPWAILGVHTTGECDRRIDIGGGCGRPLVAPTTAVFAGWLRGSSSCPVEETCQELEHFHQRDLERRRPSATRRLELHVHVSIDAVQELYMDGQLR